MKYTIEAVHEYAQKVLTTKRHITSKQLGMLIIASSMNEIHVNKSLYPKSDDWLSVYSKVTRTDEDIATFGFYRSIANAIRNLDETIPKPQEQASETMALKNINLLLQSELDDAGLSQVSKSLDAQYNLLDDLIGKYHLVQAFETYTVRYTRSNYLSAYSKDTEYLSEFYNQVKDYNHAVSLFNKLVKPDDQKKKLKLIDNPYLQDNAKSNRCYYNFRGLIDRFDNYSIFDLSHRIFFE